MTTTVVVMGSGYAGTGTVKRLESELDADAELVWVSDVDYHFVLHESHRMIRNPSVDEHVTIPIEEVAAPSTRFVQGTVTDLDVDEQSVHLADGDAVDYDYAVVALGSRTAFYGIPGLAEHSMTLKGRDDALAIHEALADAADAATRQDPAQVVIGGAGLSGIQSAGEVATYRDENRAPIDVYLVEALDEIFPGNDDSIQRALRKRLENLGVTILTDDPITEADEDTIHFDEGQSLPYDVFVWTGGITGQEALDDVELDDEHNRVHAESTFQTEDDRVFAVGDTALVDQGDEPAPPTAQAAWQAAEVVGQNVARAIEGRPLKTWRYDDKGTVISVGEKAVAHDVKYAPFVDTFGSVPAKTLKKVIATRWIKDVAGFDRARRAWPYM
jgi:NADH dehydrogenase